MPKEKLKRKIYNSANQVKAAVIHNKEQEEVSNKHFVL